MGDIGRFYNKISKRINCARDVMLLTHTRTVDTNYVLLHWRNGIPTELLNHVVKRAPCLGRVRGGGHLHGVCGRVNGYVMSTRHSPESEDLCLIQ